MIHFIFSRDIITCNDDHKKNIGNITILDFLDNLDEPVSQFMSLGMLICNDRAADSIHRAMNKHINEYSYNVIANKKKIKKTEKWFLSIGTSYNMVINSALSLKQKEAYVTQSSRSHNSLFLAMA